MPLAPRLAAHLNSTMQPVEGNTAAIRDDLRQIFAPWACNGVEPQHCQDDESYDVYNLIYNL